MRAALIVQSNSSNSVGSQIGSIAAASAAALSSSLEAASEAISSGQRAASTANENARNQAEQLKNGAATAVDDTKQLVAGLADSLAASKELQRAADDASNAASNSLGDALRDSSAYAMSGITSLSRALSNATSASSNDAVTTDSGIPSQLQSELSSNAAMWDGISASSLSSLAKAENETKALAGVLDGLVKTSISTNSQLITNTMTGMEKQFGSLKKIAQDLTAVSTGISNAETSAAANHLLITQLATQIQSEVDQASTDLVSAVNASVQQDIASVRSSLNSFRTKIYKAIGSAR
jgi:uncharacterized phage infection (PIP) family protein YhgE